jgi:hypothetical protein
VYCIAPHGCFSRYRFWYDRVLRERGMVHKGRLVEILLYFLNWNYKFRTYQGLRGKPKDVHGTQEYGERARVLREAFNAGMAKLDSFRSTVAGSLPASGLVNKDRPLIVFAAPEWLFRKSRNESAETPVESQFYTERDRETHVGLLTELSAPRGNADILMVAGSMLWCRPRDEQALKAIEQRQKEYRNKQTRKHGKIPEEAASALAVQDKLVTGDLKKLYLAYNEAFVFYNGGLRKSILKSANVGDFVLSAIEKQVELVPGLGAGTFSLEVGGQRLKTGVSICFDASRTHKYGRSVNLYILVSETVGTEVVPDETLRPGGLMVYSDGTEQAEIIEMKAADRVVPLQQITDGDFVLGVASIKPG